jgi:cystathionine beta-synthase
MNTIIGSDDRRVYDGIEAVIGQTPLIRLNRVTEDLACGVYAKLEMLNPGGSVKDRIAFSILDAYEASGDLKPGGTVVEATSGNTGIGLAIACAIRGYKSIFVLPDKMSQEKVSMLRAFGAKVVVTPTAVAPEDPRSYYSVANRLVQQTPGAVLANQYHNPANPQSHYDTTGPEIWGQTQGKVTDLVCGMGTGGTITGIGRYFRDSGHDVRIIGVDPEGSILYDAWKNSGVTDGLEAESYLVEGIGEDFIPSTLDLSLVDEVIQVSDAESFAWTRRLVREEGIFCGGSCGAALAGAVKYAQGLGPERNVVVILPDSGSRYLSKVFDDAWMQEHGFSTQERELKTVRDVAEAMGSQELITAEIDDRVRDVIELMREHAVSQLPVLDQTGTYIGVISEVDLLNAIVEVEPELRAEKTISDVAIRSVPTLRADMDFVQAIPEITTQKVAILVDEDNKPAGILTVIDALTWMSKQKTR